MWGLLVIGAICVVLALGEMFFSTKPGKQFKDDTFSIWDAMFGHDNDDEKR